MTLLAVVDFETAGDDPATPVEFGVVWLQLRKGGGVQLVGQAGAPLRYRGPPAPSARGVHHLPPGYLRRARHPSTVAQRHWRAEALVAVHHNAAYDGPLLCDLLRSAGLPQPPLTVCTYRAARHLYPGAPDYRLGTLRYLLGVRAAPPAWAYPHRALYDAIVTAAVLKRMLSLRSLQELVRLSDPLLPALLPAVTFGQYRGKQWAEVPADYLGWMMRTARRDAEAFDVDVRHSARTEIMRRRAVVQAARVQPQPQPENDSVTGRADDGGAAGGSAQGGEASGAGPPQQQRG